MAASRAAQTIGAMRAMHADLDAQLQINGVQHTTLAKEFVAMHAQHAHVAPVQTFNVDSVACQAALNNDDSFGTLRWPNLDAIRARSRRQNLFPARDFSWCRPTTDLMRLLQLSAQKMFGEGATVCVDKLMAHSPSWQVTTFCETPMSEKHVGTIVVALGSEFEGGTLAFPGAEISEPDKADNVFVFFCDTPHTVAPVTQGVRLFLVLQVFAADPVPAAFRARVRSYVPPCSDEIRAAVVPELPGTQEFAEATGSLQFPMPLPFAQGVFATELRAFFAGSNKAVIFMCEENVPAAEHSEGTACLTDLDQHFAHKVAALGYDVRVVSVLMTSLSDTSGLMSSESTVYALSDDPELQAKMRDAHLVKLDGGETDTFVFATKISALNTVVHAWWSICTGLLVMPKP